MTKQSFWMSLVLAIAGTAIGCTGGGDVMGNPDSGTQNDAGGGGDDAATTDDTGTQDVDSGTDVDSGPTGCPALASRDLVEVASPIDADTTWTCDHNYHLSDLTFVINDSTLTVEAGVRVTGGDASALIITRGSDLQALGTVTEPIVFTSENYGTATDPGAGDWGGVVLLGDAPINVSTSSMYAQIEGIDPTLYGSMIQFGGTDEAANCGHLRYVRIEYAGFAFAPDNELNGLTLGGCGTATHIEYVEVMLGLDDAIEQFGGAAQYDHLVLTATGDDSFDWDFGFHGNVQFLLAIQYPNTPGEDNGIEADNNRDANDATPRSAPEIWNATFVGPGHTASSTERAFLLRRGTGGHVHNAIFTEFPLDCGSVRDAATAAQYTSASPIDHSIFFNCGASGTTYFDAGGSSLITGGLLTAITDANRLGTDPGLPTIDRVNPNMVPTAGSAASMMAGTPPTGFDTTATYVGALEPGTTTPWYAGWTRFEAPPL